MAKAIEQRADALGRPLSHVVEDLLRQGLGMPLPDDDRAYRWTPDVPNLPNVPKRAA